MLAKAADALRNKAVFEFRVLLGFGVSEVLGVWGFGWFWGWERREEGGWVQGQRGVLRRVKKLQL